jgi:hypothetical protein
MVFGAWQAWIYVQPQPEQVFVKTFDCPEGKMADVVPADDTPVVQWWWYEPDRHLVYHEDGKLTYVDTATLRQIVRDQTRAFTHSPACCRPEGEPASGVPPTISGR